MNRPKHVHDEANRKAENSKLGQQWRSGGMKGKGMEVTGEDIKKTVTRRSEGKCMGVRNHLESRSYEERKDASTVETA